MKKLIKGNKHTNFDYLVDKFLAPLDYSDSKSRQKILEICHTGKFLYLLDEYFTIHKISEKPDFILKGENVFVGLEHQTIVDEKSRQREGFFQNIFQNAELILQNEGNLPNFLANCHLLPHVNFKLNEKKELIEIVVDTIKTYILSGQLKENPLIESIFSMDHSQITVSVNLGAWWQKDITQDILQEAIEKKNRLLKSYEKKNISEQWLLLVIGSIGASSYRVDRLGNIKIQSEFDRVYIMEDLYSNLYQIK